MAVAAAAQRTHLPLAYHYEILYSDNFISEIILPDPG